MKTIHLMIVMLLLQGCGPIRHVGMRRCIDKSKSGLHGLYSCACKWNKRAMEKEFGKGYCKGIG